MLRKGIRKRGAAATCHLRHRHAAAEDQDVGEVTAERGLICACRHLHVRNRLHVVIDDRQLRGFDGLVLERAVPFEIDADRFAASEDPRHRAGAEVEGHVPHRPRGATDARGFAELEVLRGSHEVGQRRGGEQRNG